MRASNLKCALQQNLELQTVVILGTNFHRSLLHTSVSAQLLHRVNGRLHLVNRHRMQTYYLLYFGFLITNVVYFVGYTPKMLLIGAYKR